MTLYEITDNTLAPVARTDFSVEKITERHDLQRLLLKDLSIIEPGLFPICEEYSPWQDSDRRIDILALDKKANIVVIELKRTKDGGHMELQALRYAAMVSALSFDDVVEAHAAYLEKNGQSGQGREAILDFLGLDAPDEADFGSDVRIFLVSADFAKEVTTTVLWLNQRGLDIRCVRMKPYNHLGKVLVDVQRIIPLPEAEEYQVRLKEKEQQRRKAISKRKSLQEIRELVAGMPERFRQMIGFVERELAVLGYEPFAMSDGIAWNLITNEQKNFFVKFTPQDPAAPSAKEHRMHLWFSNLVGRPPFDTPEAESELRGLFEALPQLELQGAALPHSPSYPLELIATERDAQALVIALKGVAEMSNAYRESHS